MDDNGRAAVREDRGVSSFGVQPAFSARNPLELEFDEGKRGKRVYFAAWWETGAMKKGTESDIFNAVIP